MRKSKAYMNQATDSPQSNTEAAYQHSVQPLCLRVSVVEAVEQSQLCLLTGFRVTFFDIPKPEIAEPSQHLFRRSGTQHTHQGF